nr:ribonuclease H-like domain-containing protein [Tanacetum cinerariifolium]
MFDSDNYYSSESDYESWLPSSLYDRFQPSGGYHAVPPPYTRKFMPPKPDLVFNTAPTAIGTDHLAFNVQLSPTKPEQDLSHTTRPIAPIIEDWQLETSIPAPTPTPASAKSTSSGKRRNRKACFHMIPTAMLTQSKPVFTTVVRPVNAAMSKSPIRRYITRSPSPKTSNSPPRVTVVKAPVVSAAHGNMSYLSNFDELNEGYVAFEGNLKGGKKTGKGKIKTGKLDFDDVYFVNELKFNLFSVSQMCDKKNSVLFIDTECLVLSPEFKLPDESQVLLRVLREHNMYNVNLKNIVPSGDLTCLFAKASIDESNLWHRRLGHINFKSINKLVKDSLLPIPFWAEAVNTTCYVQNKVLVTKPHNKTLYELLHGRTQSIGFMRPFGCLVTILNTLDPLGKFQRKVDKGFLVGYSNNDEDTAFDGKEHDFDAKKSKSEIDVSSSSSAHSRKQDDKTKKEAKGNSHVESFTGYKDLNAEFEACSNNSSNEVN